MARKEEYDIVVVGGGTSGTFAAGTAADRGLDVALLERKSEEEGGHIACGDAVHNPLNGEEFPGPMEMERVVENDDVLIDSNIEKGEYWDEELGVKKEVDFRHEPGNVVDRYEWGQSLLEEADRLGAELHFDTIVNDVLQEDGQVTGVEAVRDGEPVTYESELVVDAAGARSVLQDWVDFSDSWFEQPDYDHFGSAYREIIETDEPVDYEDSIVVKPVTGEDLSLGYFWYFPRTPTEINVGWGFQMSEDPVPMVEVVEEDLEDRPEYDGADVKETLGREDKLGAALGLRRPLDSMVSDGYIAVGCGAGMTSPTTGKGITGAAISGFSAGKHGSEAVLDGDTSEENLWSHNNFIFSEHGEGAKLATQDVYNVAGSAYDVDELRAAVALLPVDSLMHGISGKGEGIGLLDKGDIALDLAVNMNEHYKDGGFDELDATMRDGLRVINDFRKVAGVATDIHEHYLDFPEDPHYEEGDWGRYRDWLEERNELDEQVLEVTGAEDKYPGVHI